MNTEASNAKKIKEQIYHLRILATLAFVQWVKKDTLVSSSLGAQVVSLVWVCGNILCEASSSKAFYKAVAA